MGVNNPNRVVTQILNAYIDKEIAPVYRRSILLGMLKSRGRISFNQDGKKVEWLPQVDTRDIVAGDDNPTAITFNSSDVFDTAELDWVQYTMGEKITKYERLVGQSKKNARFKVYETALKQMSKDFVAKFGPKFYGDGNAGTGLELSGFDTCLGYSGASTLAPIALPSDSYAGMDTTLGGLGGAWVPDTGGGYPTGTGDPIYHAWSPLIVNYLSDLLGGDSATWQDQWQHAIGYLVTYMQILQNCVPDVLLLNAALLNSAKSSLIGKQRFEITQNSELTKLGHKTLNYEGIEIAAEYGIPDSSGYLLCWDELELRSMQSQLVATETDFEIASSTNRIAMDFYGQLIMYAPSYVGGLVGISDSSS